MLFDIFKKAPKRSEKDVPPNSRFTFGGTRATITYKEAVEAELALCHPVLFRVIDKICTAVQSVEWYVDQDPNSDVKVSKADIKKYQDVFSSPNDSMTAEQFRYWLSMCYATHRKAVIFASKNDGQINGLYPLDARYVDRKFNDRGTIIGYDYGSSRDKFYPSRSRQDSKGFAFEVYSPTLQGTPLSDKQYTPLRALGLPAEIITLLMRRAIDTAGGHPNSKYVVVAERSLTNDQKAAIMDHLERMSPGELESGQVLVLYNTKVEIHKLDNNLDDIHSKVPLDDMARMIAGVYGIPVSLLGLAAADGAKFAGNYVESRRSFWEDTIIPGYLSPIGKGLAKNCLPEGARLAWDLDSIEALRDVRTKRAKELTLVTFLEQNEKRDLCGFEPLAYELAPAVPGVKPNNPSSTKVEDEDED